MTQFLRDQASDSEEVVTPLMLDGTYLSRNFATLGPLPDSRRVSHSLVGGFILCETHDREEARAPEIKVDEREVEPETLSRKKSHET